MSYEEDEWYARQYHRGGGLGYGHVPAPPPLRDPYRASGTFLSPGIAHGTSLHRSRSHGHAPAPNVHVYNYNRNDLDAESSRSPSPYRGRARASSRARPGVDEDILDEVTGIRNDLRRDRSRGRSDASFRDPSPRYYPMPGALPNWEAEHLRRDADLRVQWERDQARRKTELSRLRQKIADEERENELKSIEERYKTAAEMERMKSDLKKKQDAYEAEEYKKKILREAAEEEEEQKEAQAKAVADWERKKEQQEKDRKAAEKAA
ncbi:hypothetical protein LTS18_011200, partial [Coniosporium uncinatum]